MLQTEEMEKSKEELMEELMAKLKEDLVKGRIKFGNTLVEKMDKEECLVKEHDFWKDAVGAYDAGLWESW